MCAHDPVGYEVENSRIPHKISKRRQRRRQSESNERRRREKGHYYTFAFEQCLCACVCFVRFWCVAEHRLERFRPRVVRVPSVSVCVCVFFFVLPCERFKAQVHLHISSKRAAPI